MANPYLLLAQLDTNLGIGSAAPERTSLLPEPTVTTSKTELLASRKEEKLSVLGTATRSMFSDADTLKLPGATKGIRVGETDGSFPQAPESPWTIENRKHREVTEEDQAKYNTEMKVLDNYAAGVVGAPKEAVQDLVDNPLSAEDEATYKQYIKETQMQPMDVTGVEGHLTGDPSHRQIGRVQNPTQEDTLQERLISSGIAPESQGMAATSIEASDNHRSVKPDITVEGTFGIGMQLPEAVASNYASISSRGAEFVGSAMKAIGESIDFTDEDAAKVDAEHGISTRVVDGISNFLQEEGAQIEKEQQQWRKNGSYDELVGYNSKPVQEFGKELADLADKGEYLQAFGHLFDTRAVTAFAQSLPEMIVMGNPFGLGAMIGANVNTNLNELENNAKKNNQEVTAEDKATSAALSTVGTLLDRLGDKVTLGSAKGLTSLLKGMPTSVKTAVNDVFGDNLKRIGVEVASLAPKAGVEGTTEAAQTLLEGKASDLDKMNLDITEKERREALEAGMIGTAAGGVPSIYSGTKAAIDGTAAFSYDKLKEEIARRKEDRNVEVSEVPLTVGGEGSLSVKYGTVEAAKAREVEHITGLDAHIKADNIQEAINGVVAYQEDIKNDPEGLLDKAAFVAKVNAIKAMTQEAAKNVVTTNDTASAKILGSSPEVIDWALEGSSVEDSEKLLVAYSKSFGSEPILPDDPIITRINDNIESKKALVDVEAEVATDITVKADAIRNATSPTAKEKAIVDFQRFRDDRRSTLGRTENWLGDKEQEVLDEVLTSVRSRPDEEVAIDDNRVAKKLQELSNAWRNDSGLTDVMFKTNDVQSKPVSVLKSDVAKRLLNPAHTGGAYSILLSKSKEVRAFNAMSKLLGVDGKSEVAKVREELKSARQGKISPAVKSTFGTLEGAYNSHDEAGKIDFIANLIKTNVGRKPSTQTEQLLSNVMHTEKAIYDKANAKLQEESVSKISKEPIGVEINGLDEAISNGALGRQLSIKENRQDVKFKQFVLGVDENTKTATVDFAEKEQGASKGVGYRAYVELGKQLASRGYTLTSSTTQQAQGKNLWDKLVIDGYATKKTNVYTFINSDENLKKIPEKKIDVTTPLTESIRTRVTTVNDLTYKTPDTENRINTLRKYGSNKDTHYGNPFGTDAYGNAAEVPKQGTDAEVSKKYIDWLKGTFRPDVAPKRRQWIIDQIKAGVLDGKELMYKFNTPINHAKALMKLVNDKALLSNTSPKSTEVELKAIKSNKPIKNLSIPTISDDDLSFDIDANEEVVDIGQGNVVEDKAAEEIPQNSASDGITQLVNGETSIEAEVGKPSRFNTELRTSKKVPLFEGNTPNVEVTSVEELKEVANIYHQFMTRNDTTDKYTKHMELFNNFIDMLGNANISFIKHKITLVDSRSMNNQLGHAATMKDSTGEVKLSNDQVSDAYPIKVLIHEYTHLLTQTALDKSPVLLGRVRSLMTYALEANKELVKEHGFTDEKEFVAEVISSPRLQVALSKIKSITPEKTLLEDVKEVFGKILQYVARLGAKGTLPKSLLDDSLKLVLEVISSDKNTIVKPKEDSPKNSDKVTTKVAEVASKVRIFRGITTTPKSKKPTTFTVESVESLVEELDNVNGDIAKEQEIANTAYEYIDVFDVVINKYRKNLEMLKSDKIALQIKIDNHKKELKHLAGVIGYERALRDKSKKRHELTRNKDGVKARALLVKVLEAIKKILVFKALAKKFVVEIKNYNDEMFELNIKITEVESKVREFKQGKQDEIAIGAQLKDKAIKAINELKGIKSGIVQELKNFIGHQIIGNSKFNTIVKNSNSKKAIGNQEAIVGEDVLTVRKSKSSLSVDVNAGIEINKALDTLMQPFMEEGDLASDMAKEYVDKVFGNLDNVYFTNELKRTIENNPARLLFNEKENSKGLELHPNVYAAINKALLEYLMKNGSGMLFVDKERVAKMLGLKEAWQVSPKALSTLGDKVFKVSMADSLGRTILKDLGIKINPKVAAQIRGNNAVKFGTEQLNNLQELLQADVGQLAILIGSQYGIFSELDSNEAHQITAATYKGFIGETSVDNDENIKIDLLTIGDVGKELLKTKEVYNVVNKIMEDYFEDDTLAEVRVEPVNPKKKVEYKVDAKLFEMSDLSKEVIEKASNQEWGITNEIIDLYNTLEHGENEGLLREYLGFMEESIDSNGAKSIPGLAYVDSQNQIAKNNAINLKLQLLESMISRIDNIADKNLYYEYFFGANGRFYNDNSEVNPQNDTFSRFVVGLKSHKQTVDLTKAVKSTEVFYKGLSQAFGKGFDKVTTKAAVAEGKKFLAMGSEELIRRLQDIDTDVDHIGHYMNGVVAVQQFEAVNKGITKASWKPFDSTLKIEVDAGTSGIMLKLMQVPIVKNSVEATKKLLVKGGFVFSGVPEYEEFKGTNELVGEGRLLDLYKTVAAEFAQSIGKRINDGSWKVAVADDAKHWQKVAANVTNNRRIRVKKVAESIVPKFSTTEVTSAMRNLFKPVVMVFGYGGGIKSIKRAFISNIVEELPTKLLEEMNNPDVKDIGPVEEFFRVYADNESTFNTLVKNLTVKDILEMKQGRKTLRALMMEDLGALYADNLGTTLTEVFGSEIIEANETLNNVFRMMFKMYNHVYQKRIKAFVVENGYYPEETEKAAIMLELKDLFPAIQPPFATDANKGVIVDYNRVTDNNIVAQTQGNFERTTNGKKQQSISVAAMVKEFEEAVTSGNVISIHYIDGTIIGKSFMNIDGLEQVFDAVVGGTGNIFEGAVEYNKQAFEISRSYNLVDKTAEALQNAVVALKNIDQKGFETFMAAESVMDKELSIPGSMVKDTKNLAYVLRDIEDLARTVEVNRAELFSVDAKSDHSTGLGAVVSFKGLSKPKYKYVHKANVVKESITPAVTAKDKNVILPESIVEEATSKVVKKDCKV